MSRPSLSLQGILSLGQAWGILVFSKGSDGLPGGWGAARAGGRGVSCLCGKVSVLAVTALVTLASASSLDLAVGALSAVCFQEGKVFCDRQLCGWFVSHCGALGRAEDSKMQLVL